VRGHAAHEEGRLRLVDTANLSVTNEPARILPRSPDKTTKSGLLNWHENRHNNRHGCVNDGTDGAGRGCARP
jgi:hypothetical protein